jgi:hypothetical protein
MKRRFQMTLKTYTVKESQTLHRYTTVEANSKAEALRLVDDGYVDFPDDIRSDNATYKVTGQIISTDMTRVPWE